MPAKLKLLYLDIETYPNLAHVWRLWDENIPIDRLLSEGGVLCWAAKWEGSKEVITGSIQEDSWADMIKRMYDLLDEADAVVTYNGDKFDLPFLNRLFLNIGLGPPSPYKKLDLLKTVRQNFKFASNKLDYVAEQLGLGKKKDHRGYKTWLGCLSGEEAAWDVMTRYNKHDVQLTQKLYKRLKPWIKSHPNMGLLSDSSGKRPVCPTCGSVHLQKRGTAYTNATAYQRYRCNSCGSWSRSRFSDPNKKSIVLVKYN